MFDALAAGSLRDSRRVARLRAGRRPRCPRARRREPARGQAGDREARRNACRSAATRASARAIRAATRSPPCSARQQIDELPDDPDEMEQVLSEMAGPGAVLRVNGFRGGRLPPKRQIQQIRFRRNMFAADMHEPGFVSVDITTKPGLDNWRGVDQPRLSRRGAERAQRVRAGEGRRAARALRLLAERAAVEAAHVALAVGRRHRRVRHQDDRRGAALGLFRRLDPQAERRAERDRAARARADASRRCCAPSCSATTRTTENLGVGDFDLVGARLQPERTEKRAPRVGRRARSARRSTTSCGCSGAATTPRSHRASTAPAVLVLNAFNAGGAQLAGARGTRRRRHSPTISTSRSGGTRSAPACSSTPAAIAPTSCATPAGTFTFAEPRRVMRPARPTTFTRNVGDPRADDLPGAARPLRPGRLPRAQGPDGQRRRARGIAVAHRRPPPRAARRHCLVAVQERQDDGPRRRRHLLRLVRRASLRSRACSSTARISRSRRSCSRAIPIAALGGRR